MLATALCSLVRQAAQLPGGTSAVMADADILKLADLEIATALLPEVRRVNQEYMVSTVDLAVSAGAAGFVALPTRAQAGGVRHVALVVNGVARPLPRLDVAQNPGAQGGAPLPWGYYLDGGGLRLVPTSAAGTVRVRYYAAPGALVLETDTDVSRVSGATYNSGTGNYDITTASSGAMNGGVELWGSSGTLNDLYCRANPFSGNFGSFAMPAADCQHPPREDDYAVRRASISAQWVSRCPIVPLPEELVGVLVARVAARCLLALGYVSEAQAQTAWANDALARAVLLLTPRNTGNMQRLTGGIRAALGQQGWGFEGGYGPWGGW